MMEYVLYLLVLLVCGPVALVTGLFLAALCIVWVSDWVKGR